MKIIKHGNNQTVIVTKDGREILVSYSTPVAMFDGNNILRTNKRHSVTTSKHIASWIHSEHPGTNVLFVKQEECDGWL